MKVQYYNKNEEFCPSVFEMTPACQTTHMVYKKIHKYYPIPCLGKILSLFGHLKQQGLTS